MCIILYILALLGECNLTFDDALFVHLYVQDMQQFNSINKVYCAYFGQNPASRYTFIKI